MPPDIVKTRGESNIVWNFMRLVEDGVVSEEKLITMLGDASGLFVSLRGTDGAALDLGTGLVTIGQIDDAIVAAGAAGTLSAKQRRMTQGLEDLKTMIILAAGTNVIG
ncbi:MAG: hypothetical protein KKD44_26280, partial [Proteobacteria bacterium]|nr:hypothetical protein [Pseudomonadota bacterium]